MRKIPNPHDAYFKHAMADLLTAQAYVQEQVPQEILAQANWNTLKIEPTSFVDPQLKSSFSDMLYSVELNKEKAYLYFLIEHKKEPDKWVTLQLLGYILEIMKKHKNENHPTLPVVWATIYYNGDTPYPYSTDVFSLFGEQEALAREVFLKPFPLIDLNLIADEDLKQSTRLGIMKFMHKHNFKRDFLINLQEILPFLEVLKQQNAEDFILATLNYGFHGKVTVEDYAKIVKLIEEKLSPHLGERVMSLAEYFEQKGIEKGIEKGGVETSHRIAYEMLKAKADPIFVAKVTKLPLAEVLAMNEELVSSEA